MAFCDFGIIWSSDVSYCQIDNMIHYVGAAIFHVSASGQSVSKALMQSGYINKKNKVHKFVDHKFVYWCNFSYK
jgi:hypothetical protein